MRITTFENHHRTMRLNCLSYQIHIFSVCFHSTTIRVCRVFLFLLLQSVRMFITKRGIDMSHKNTFHFRRLLWIHPHEILSAEKGLASSHSHLLLRHSQI